MLLTTDELLKGKATMIKGKEYLSTEAYVTPFLERMSKFTNEFIVQAKLSDQMSITKKEDLNLEDTVFNRVWIQAVLPGEYAYDNHVQSVSMLYALDTRKPIVKIFKNTINQACLNMCVFSPEHLEVQEIQPESCINYKFVENVMKMADFTKTMLEQLSKIEYNKETIYTNLGEWIDNCINSKYDNGFGKVKLSESTPVSAYKSLFYDKDSPYYSKDNIVDGFTVYNSFTDLISNDKGKDIVNKFEKTYLVGKIMGLY